MKILLVSNQYSNDHGVGNPIMHRMKDSLLNHSEISDVMFIPFKNNISSILSIRKSAKSFDLIHVHFGGAYALLLYFCLLGLKKPFFITFHGTDIHAKSIKCSKSLKKKIKIRINQWCSFLCLCLYSKSGFVANEMKTYIPKCIENIKSKDFFMQPLGVDYNKMIPIPMDIAKIKIGLNINQKYILFSDISNTTIKRRDIAIEIANKLKEYKLLIMCGVNSELVPYYINSCDFLLLTSDEEGSPNIIRECLALNKRVFSVNVGDVSQQLKGLVNSSIISRNAIEAQKQITEILKFPYTDNTRESRRNILDFNLLNNNIIELYKQVINKQES